MSEPITLLFDEVQDDENWSKTLKILYDEAKTAFILCTGSSALLLNQSADLARRMRTERIYPFKFTEFVAAKTYLENKGKTIYPEENLPIDLKEALFYSENPADAHRKIKAYDQSVSSYFAKLNTLKTLPLKELIHGYINYRNIPNFLFHKDTYTINDSILDLFKRVILEDIPKLKPTFVDFTRIEKLILRLAGSDEINPEKLAGIIGVRQNEVHELIDILAKVELMNVLLPYGGLDTRITKMRKAFFMTPSLRRALLSTLYGQNLPEHLKSKLLEDLVVMYLRRILTEGVISFVSGGNEVNPDFIIETRDKPVVLEIGTSKTSLQQFRQLNEAHRYGLLVSEGIKKPALKNGCLQIPLFWFLLL